MWILLADDNVEIRAALRLLLGELGERDIVEAADERQLLSTVGRCPVDVILLDWELPEGKLAQPRRRRIAGSFGSVGRGTEAQMRRLPADRYEQQARGEKSSPGSPGATDSLAATSRPIGSSPCWPR